MKKVLLTTAGAGNANNIVRSLKSSKLNLKIYGANIEKFELVKSLTKINYVVPRPDDNNYINIINKIIEKENIDLLIPNHEKEALYIAKNLNLIKSNTYLPSYETIKLCIDKYKFSKLMEKNNIPVAKTIKINKNKNLENELKKLKDDPDEYVWVRIKEGAGSRGAAPFKKSEHIKFWIDYWENNKNYTSNDFIIHEFLPGRDYHFFSMWKDGKLIIGKTCERLAYTCAKYTLSGTSSSPSIAKQVYNEEVIKNCKKAVRKVDKNATGIFAIDLKENKAGEPCITEINIARFPRINIFFNLTGKYNMAEIYVRLGLGENLNIYNITDDIDEDKYLFRSIDYIPIIVSKNDIEKSFTIL
jgi:carbamoyl-phosphate synthase large subunit